MHAFRWIAITRDGSPIDAEFSAVELRERALARAREGRVPVETLSIDRDGAGLVIIVVLRGTVTASDTTLDILRAALSENERSKNLVLLSD